MSEVICDLPPEVLAALRELGEPAPIVKELAERVRRRAGEFGAP